MKKNKKIEISVLDLLIIACILIIICCLISKFLIKNDNEFLNNLIQMSNNNKDEQFRVSKIVKYSSAEATDNSVEQNLSDISIHQYSDIALYIENVGEELTEKNTIKELYLDNFNVDVSYEKGEHLLFYKNPLDISKFRIDNNNLINGKLEYKIIYTNSENEESNYDEPVFYADCSNPIVIGFVNKNIVENFNSADSLIYYDGRIFDNLDIDLNSIMPKISFKIHIVNNLDEVYGCEVKLKLDLDNSEGTIKSGYFIQIIKNINNYTFFRES